MPVDAFSPLDSIFGIALLLITLVGYWRGLGREILQLVLFIVMGAISAFVFDEHIRITHVTDIIPTLQFIAGFSLFMYVVTFLVSRFLTRRLLGTLPPSTASRWAGAAFGSGKIFAIVLGLNMAYAVINPNADRMSTMPEVVQHSAFLRLTDNIIEKAYRTLATYGIVTYSKLHYRQKTAEELKQERFEEKLGVKMPQKFW